MNSTETEAPNNGQERVAHDLEEGLKDNLELYQFVRHHHDHRSPSLRQRKVFNVLYICACWN